MNKILSQIWPSLVTAFCVSCLVSRLLAYIAVKRGKSAPTRTGGSMPLTGGIGVFFGFFLGLIVFMFNYRFREWSGLFFFYGSVFLLGVSFLYFLLGLLDDKFHFTPLQKLFLFFIVAFLNLIFYSCILVSLTNYEERSVIAFGALFMVALFFFSNSYNFLDNADGHCASAVLGLTFALFFVPDGVEEWNYAGLVLAFAVLGFLVWNFPLKPRLYLGDAGSLFLGACVPTLVFFAVYGVYEDYLFLRIFIALNLLAFPLYDTCAVMLLRALRGQNPTIGGQDHYSHRLMRGGFPLWLVNLIAFTAAGVLPAIVLKLPYQTVFFGPFIIWAFLLFLDVLAAFLCLKKSGNH
jgi:UDP-GlcNAc:undecaprenyl-phosphate GlcNAc-1-phosphate transferase